MENEFLNYVKQKTLKNYFPSKRDFLELFPKDNFNFASSEYTHFLYFDKEEATAYLKDFLLFVHKFYKCEVFSFANFYSIFDEFKKHLEFHNVYFYIKTKMGLGIANHNNELLLSTLKNLFGEQNFLGDSKKIAFSEKVLDSSTYNYEFFDYLTEKTKGYNHYKFIIEPLVQEDIDDIRNYYRGTPYYKELPFYLNPQNPYWKDIKTCILEKIVGSTPAKLYGISDENGTPKMLIIAEIDGSKCDINLICDSEYYDSDLSHAIDFVCNDLFTTFDVDKITTINHNKGIAFSGINSALTISHFKPDYSLSSEFNGYSLIRYELTKESNADNELLIDNSIIKFAY